MTSSEVVGFILDWCLTQSQETSAEALIVEARSRWEDRNKSKKNSNKIGDIPYLKNGCDDITAVIAFFEY